VPAPRRILRIVRRLAAALVVLVVVAFAAALLLPVPDGLEPLRCDKDRPRCSEASGRVLFIPSSDRSDERRPLHLVLISKQSVSLPAISNVKLEPGMRPQDTPRIGTWVSVVGTERRGSRGFPSLHAERVVFER
jgi:hypothetical protein